MRVENEQKQQFSYSRGMFGYITTIPGSMGPSQPRMIPYIVNLGIFWQFLKQSLLTSKHALSVS